MWLIKLIILLKGCEWVKKILSLVTNGVSFNYKLSCMINFFIFIVFILKVILMMVFYFLVNNDDFLLIDNINILH